MNHYDILRSKILLVSALAFISMTSVALAEDALTAQQQGDIRYITGGIGTDERDQLEVAKSDYNFHLTSAKSDGAFTDNTTITLTDRKGTSVLSAEAGPIFFAQLPAGTYTLNATHGSQSQTKTVKIGKGATNTNLFWK